MSVLSSLRIPSTVALMDFVMKYKWWLVGASAIILLALGYAAYMEYQRRRSDVADQELSSIEQEVAVDNQSGNKNISSPDKQTPSLVSEYKQENTSQKAETPVKNYAQEGVRVQRECVDSSSGCCNNLPLSSACDPSLTRCVRKQNTASRRDNRRNVPCLKNGMRQGFGADATPLTQGKDINDQLDPYIHTRHTFDGESAFAKPRYFDLMCCDSDRLPSGIQILNREEGLTWGH